MPQNNPEPAQTQPLSPEDQKALSDPKGWSVAPGSSPDATNGDPNQPESLVGDIKSYWRKAWEYVNTPLIPNAVQAVADDETKKQQAFIESEIAHDHPYRAQMAAAYYGLTDAAYDMAKGAATPLQVALAGTVGAAGKLGKAARTAGTLANLWFGWRGAENVFQARQDYETTAEYWGRVGAGAGQAGLAGIGLGATAEANLHKSIQENLGLSGDLAQKVADKVKEAANVQAAAKGQAESAQQIGQGIQENIGGTQLPKRMGETVADAAQIAAIEQARVEGLFSKLSEKAKAPVTDSADMRAEIVNTLKAHGVQDAEIPSRIFNALPAPPEVASVRRPTANEERASVMVSKWAKQGLSGDDLRANLANMQYAPNQIDRIIAMAAPQAAGDTQNVSFEASGRVANDLWEAAVAAKDPTVRRALFEAHENIQGMRQRYADDNSFGKQFSDARREYFNFKHNLGDGIVQEFLQAKNANDQAMLWRTAQIISPTQGEGLRTILKGAGIDTSPIDALVAEKDAVAAGTKATVANIQKESAAGVKAIGQAGSIIPDESDLQFAGKGTAQIRQDAVRKLAMNMKAAGIANPYAYIQITMGAARMLAGSFFGTMQVASGTSRIALQKMLANPRFQNWVISEAGISAARAPAFRTAISAPKSVNAIMSMAQEMAQNSVAARAADKATEQQKTQLQADANTPVAKPAAQVRPLTPQPTTPIRPSPRIGISR